MDKFNSLADQPIVLVYTMTNGLGDYLVMGDLMHKAKLILPQSKCVMVHRANPHILQWPYENDRDIFFNVYSLPDMLRLTKNLSAFRRRGYVIFGLQMSPGSMQGFLLQRCLKYLGSLDYIVDFNLINADVVIAPRGSYILERHLNQLSDLFNVKIPSDYYRLHLPLASWKDLPTIGKTSGRRLIGIHPWSRRESDSFFWPLNRWRELINDLLRHEDMDFVILGRDEKFEEFTDSLRRNFADAQKRFHFVPAKSITHLAKTIAELDVLLTVNTAVVHMAYALNKKTVILSGPTLDIWNPHGDHIRIVKDTQASLTGADKPSRDKRLPRVERISVQQVLNAFQSL